MVALTIEWGLCYMIALDGSGFRRSISDLSVLTKDIHNSPVLLFGYLQKEEESEEG